MKVTGWPRVALTFIIYFLLIGPFRATIEGAGLALGLTDIWAVLVPATIVAMSFYQLIGPGLTINDALALIAAAAVLLLGLTQDPETIAYETLKIAYGVGLGVIIGLILGRGGKR